MTKIADLLAAKDRVDQSMVDLKERTYAMVAASRAAGRSRDWIEGFISGESMALSPVVGAIALEFFEEAWPKESTHG